MNSAPCSLTPHSRRGFPPAAARPKRPGGWLSPPCCSSPRPSRSDRRAAEAARDRIDWKYLRDPGLQVYHLAWLLGFQETGAFTHAFRRRTGRTPTEARTCAVRSVC
ncbi:helix-turn-helix domain-containing protein [Methylobacterium nonmethylotrophicum]|uniref:Helix-turn-helix domain-containing protein n=1 Tax=Methylobacterium nonmethylotrophicum TaxID=1141884 RepID=A0A4Z0NHU3_9HYPH|nr:helix-turn-helix domain-containing protein [Methylobacterium nonmethylotrophicum]